MKLILTLFFIDPIFTADFKNPYAVRVPEDYPSTLNTEESNNIFNGVLVGYPDKVLANLLAIRSGMCHRKFQVKVNDVVFVGYPMLLHQGVYAQPSPKRELPNVLSFNVVFALPGHTLDNVVSCYCDLARQLAVAIRHEERRCEYLSQQKNLMWAIQDEITTSPEDSRECPYSMMLQRCDLAQLLKFIYDSLVNSGVVHVYVNKWVRINFCLPGRIHYPTSLSLKEPVIMKPDVIQKCLKALRPYHGLLLMEDETVLLDALPLDSSPCLSRLVRVASPLKNLQTLAMDSALPLSQVFHLACHLVYWGKATVIYPLCTTNVYVLAPDTDTFVNSTLSDKFTVHFPGSSLSAVLAEFSVPCPFSDHRNILSLPQQQVKEIQTVEWLLQHRLLIQLHTYVLFLGPDPHSTTVPRLLQISPASYTMPTHSRQSDISDSLSVNSDDAESNKSLDTLVEVQTQEEMMVSSQTGSEQLNATQQTQLRMVIQAPPVNTSSDDLKMFTRLLPYFDGLHHLEEIMFYENLKRSQLLALLDKFRALLLPCQHEDPGVTSWGGGG